MRITGTLILMLCVSQANAAILTFTNLGNTDVPQDYGDRITATLDPVTGYQYGAGSGFTPNVVVDYVDLSTGSTFPISNWTTGYGDLINAAGNSSYTGDFDLVLTPDAGFCLSLNSFDVGAWASARDGIIKVFDSDDTELFNSGVITVPGTVAGGHWSYTGPVIESDKAIRITLRDPTDTMGFWGSLALDNVNFNQSVTAIPEPSACLLLSMISVACVTRRRRRSVRGKHPGATHS